MVRIIQEKTTGKSTNMDNKKLMLCDEDIDLDYILTIGELIQMLIDIGLLEDQPYAIPLSCLEEALRKNRNIKRVRRNQ